MKANNAEGVLWSGPYGSWDQNDPSWPNNEASLGTQWSRNASSSGALNLAMLFSILSPCASEQGITFFGATTCETNIERAKVAGPIAAMDLAWWHK